MDNAQTLNKVAKIIRDVLDPTDDRQLKIDPETTVDQVDGWGSFNHSSIVVATEQAFGVRFKTAEIESLRNVGELVSLINRKLDK